MEETATYKIRIEKITPNLNLEKEKELQNQVLRSGGYNNNRNYETMPLLREEIVKDVLVVELTEAQYKAVKLEVLKTFE